MASPSAARAAPPHRSQHYSRRHDEQRHGNSQSAQQAEKAQEEDREEERAKTLGGGVGGASATARSAMIPEHFSATVHSVFDGAPPCDNGDPAGLHLFVWPRMFPSPGASLATRYCRARDIVLGGPRRMWHTPRGQHQQQQGGQQQQQQKGGQNQQKGGQNQQKRGDSGALVMWARGCHVLPAVRHMRYLDPLGHPLAPRILRIFGDRKRSDPLWLDVHVAAARASYKAPVVRVKACRRARAAWLMVLDECGYDAAGRRKTDDDGDDDGRNSKLKNKDGKNDGKKKKLEAGRRGEEKKKANNKQLVGTVMIRITDPLRLMQVPLDLLKSQFTRVLRADIEQRVTEQPQRAAGRGEREERGGPHMRTQRFDRPRGWDGASSKASF